MPCQSVRSCCLLLCFIYFGLCGENSALKMHYLEYSINVV